MIDPPCNYYLAPGAMRFSLSTSIINSDRNEFRQQSMVPSSSSNVPISHPSTVSSQSSLHDIKNSILKLPFPRIHTVLQSQYPPQASSTGSISPDSSLSTSASPTYFASPTSFPASPQAQNVDFGSSYPWNTYARDQYSYMQNSAAEICGSMGMTVAPPLYQHWTTSPYALGATLEDFALSGQLHRRSVRCGCPNCKNEMSGLPPIVGPDERGRKQHLCHIAGCNRVYGKASHLKTHLRWHTGERPYPCVACGKRFSRSDELQRHKRTHTNYRPYICPICAKRFSRSDHLSKHRKIHLKQKKLKNGTAGEATTSEDKGLANSDAAANVIPKPEPTPAIEVTSPKPKPIKVANGTPPVQQSTTESFYQSPHLVSQFHQQSAQLSAHNQPMDSSSFYTAPASVGDSQSTSSYMQFQHMQYEQLQTMNQPTNSYPIKSDSHYHYPNFYSNNMIASATTPSSNYAGPFHQPWNTSGGNGQEFF